VARPNPFCREMRIRRVDAGGLPETLIKPTVGVLFGVTLRYTIREAEDMIAQPSP
jgi:hypothetical protein